MPNVNVPAAAPGLPILTRRRVLAASSLLGLAAIPASPILGATPDSEIMQLFREWLATMRYTNELVDVARPDIEEHLRPIHEHRWVLLNKLAAIEAHTAGEVMAQVIATCDFGETWLSNSDWGQTLRDSFVARLGIDLPCYAAA